MKRGEIRLVAGGVYASKPRPAVVIDAPVLRLPIPSTEVSGIGADSYAMIDTVTTVRRMSVGEQVGTISPQQLVELERRLMVFFGLAR